MRDDRCSGLLKWVVKQVPRAFCRVGSLAKHRPDRGVEVKKSNEAMFDRLMFNRAIVE